MLSAIKSGNAMLDRILCLNGRHLGMVILSGGVQTKVMRKKRPLFAPFIDRNDNANHGHDRDNGKYPAHATKMGVTFVDYKIGAT